MFSNQLSQLLFSDSPVNNSIEHVIKSPRNDCAEKKNLLLCLFFKKLKRREESELDWRAYSRILQCKSRPPQPSFRDESQIIVQSNQELQLATLKKKKLN
ncbi:hypothetical protein ACTFIR_009699 [Dictyostelium discoideum]